MHKIKTIGQSNIQFQFTPQTITEAVSVLRHSLLADEELYNAFIASIESAMKELPEVIDLHNAAMAIADRIIGS